MSFADLVERFSSGVSHFFQPILQPIFTPISDAMAHVYEPWATGCAVGLFILAMLWVCFGLRKEFVNLDAPHKGILYDLRVWTVLSMLPHVIVYFYFE